MAENRACAVPEAGHERSYFDTPADGWRCDCGAWLGREPKPPAQCRWNLIDEDGDFGGPVFETACGQHFQFNNGDGILGNNFKFCCFCGGTIVRPPEQT